MNNLLVESATASRAFGAASVTKAKPITASLPEEFWGTGVGAGEPLKLNITPHKRKTPHLDPQNKEQTKTKLRSVSPLGRVADAG